jgi:hypothetical protein
MVHKWFIAFKNAMLDQEMTNGETVPAKTILPVQLIEGETTL